MLCSTDRQFEITEITYLAEDDRDDWKVSLTFCVIRFELMSRSVSEGPISLLLPCRLLFPTPSDQILGLHLSCD
jgi:hypothetical protein